VVQRGDAAGACYATWRCQAAMQSEPSGTMQAAPPAAAAAAALADRRLDGCGCGCGSGPGSGSDWCGCAAISGPPRCVCDARPPARRCCRRQAECATQAAAVAQFSCCAADCARVMTDG
jgi:hypothetical protein